MAGTTNHDRVGKVIEVLCGGLTPFARQEFEAAFGKDETQAKVKTDQKRTVHNRYLP